jgi:tRNA pseudouridine38-40 synthase
MSLHPFEMIALWCWYRGEAFHGYQGQGALRTVQAELLRAFRLAGLTRNPVVGGRTDKGVSARMQVLSARLERGAPLDGLAARLDAHLPADLGIHLARPAPAGFHAAWSASSKEYRYALSPEQLGDPELFARAAALVPGTRDFRVFHFKTSLQMPRTVRTVELRPPDGGVRTVRFEGDGFGRYMVRMLTGGLSAVARGLVPLEVFVAGLTEQRNFHCPTAPPEPLTLWEIGYPPQLDPFTPEERSAFAWPQAR